MFSLAGEIAYILQTIFKKTANIVINDPLPSLFLKQKNVQCNEIMGIAVCDTLHCKKVVDHMQSSLIQTPRRVRTLC